MIVFDLDGTLIDSSEGIYSAYLKSCAISSVIPIQRDIFVASIGPPFPSMLHSLHPGLTNDQSGIICSNFSGFYSSPVFYKQFTLRDGTYTFLSDLLRHHKLSVLSNKITSTASAILSMEHLDPFFQFIAGRDFFGDHYTKTNNLKKLVLEGLIPHGSTYVGDTLSDSCSAIDCDLKFIGLKSLFKSAVVNPGFVPDYDSLLNQLCS